MGNQLGIVNEFGINLDPKIKESLQQLLKENDAAKKLQVKKQSAPMPEIFFPVKCTIRYSVAIRPDYKYGEEFHFPWKEELADMQKN